MKIDWFTVIAQGLNFIILVWILKRLLYKPILNTIAEREKSIADKINHATEMEEEANKLQEFYKDQTKELEGYKSELLNRIDEDVKVEKQKLLDEVKKESDTLRTKVHKNINDEEEKVINEFVKNIEKEIYLTSEQVVSDLANSKLQEQIIEVFFKKLNDFKDNKESILNVDISNQPVLVKSAIELEKATKENIANKINKIQPHSELKFEIEQNLIAGIELYMNGHKIGWNIKDYMKSLKKVNINPQ